MPIVRLFIFAVALTLAAVIARPDPAAAQQAVGSISGDVVDAVTQRPIGRGTVVLRMDTQARERQLTGQDRGFDFADIPEGLYTLEVTAPGYLPAANQTVRVSPGKAALVTFEMTRSPAGLEEILVVGSSLGTDPAASVSATRITREDIRSAVGSGGDVFRALDSLPGVISTGEFSTFSVRGRGPRDNLILVDNMPFDKVVHFDQTLGEDEDIGGGGRFSIFAPNLIGDASFEPGGWSAAYSGRNGSLLSLNIAEGNRESPTFSVRADIAGGEVTYDGPSYVSGNTSVLLSARYFDFGRVFKLIGQDDIGDPEVSDVIFKSVTQVSDVDTFSLLAIYSPEDFSRDIENVLNSPDFEDADLLRSEQDSVLIGGTWTWLFGDTGQMSNTFFYRTTDKFGAQGESFPDLAGPDPLAEDIAVREDALTVREDETELGWRNDFSFETGLGTFAAGARVSRVSLDFESRVDGDFFVYVYDQNDFRPTPDQKYVVLTPARFNAAFNGKAYRYAAFVEHAFDAGALTLRPGVRVDRDGFADQTLWSPRLSATYQAAPNTRVSATAGIYYQHPRYLSIAADPANNTLRNERADQFSVGVEQNFGPHISVLVEAYRQDLKNLVIESDASTGLASNDGSGHATGVDVVLTKRITDSWSGTATYSYSRSRRDDNNGTPSYTSDFNRPHALTLGGVWEPSDRWRFGAKWKYASGRPTDSFIVSADVFNDPALPRFSKELTANNVSRLRDYHSLNLRVDYRRRIGGVTLVTFLDVINAYGRNNVSSLEWDERRGVNVIGNFGVFPQIGLKAEF